MRRLLATPTVGAKVQQIEADRHRFGWKTMHPTVHVVTVDGDRLRYQLLARPDGIAHGDPAHDQIAAYTAVAGGLSIAGEPVAVTYTAELCEHCAETGAQRTAHLRGHTPAFLVLAGVDITGHRYVILRRRDDKPPGHHGLAARQPRPRHGGEPDAAPGAHRDAHPPPSTHRSGHRARRDRQRPV